MNENLNLVEILKDCPKGTKLYSSVLGEVELEGVTDSVSYPIIVKLNEGQFEERIIETFTSDGRLIATCKGECVLFPSRDQRDWSKFNPKKERFDPKTLHSFDRVICKNGLAIWRCDLFSFYLEGYACPNVCVGCSYTHCIPYNEDTKHLVGTDSEAPEYYRYWED